MKQLCDQRPIKGQSLLLCSDAPDTSGQQQAALMEANLSKEQLDWGKQIYADTAPDRAAAAARANAVSDAQLASMKQADQQSQDYANYQTSTFRPLEQKMATDALGYDTPQRREAAAGQAMADVGSQADQGREAAMRDEAARGVDPSSGNSAIALARMGIGGAAAEAAAGNAARKQVETIGAAKLADAANLGRGIASSQATQAGLALNAGNSSVASANAALAPGQNAQAALSGAYGGARSGYNAAGGIYGNIANENQAATNENNKMNSAAGSAVGSLALLALSDKKAKKSIKRESPEVSLAAIKKIPVSRWNYRTGKGDGGRHTGPMAQDVRAALGEQAAPGGTAIDLVSMNGHAMNAIKAIDKRVVSLEHAKIVGKKRAAA